MKNFNSNTLIAVVMLLAGAVSMPAMGDTVALRLEGGVYVLPVRINDAITLEFTLDSGAADVSLPLDVASTLLRTGTLAKSDFVGTKKYSLANGTIEKEAIVVVRRLQIGQTVLINVRASIGPANGPLLLGQSFLSRLRAWSFDNSRHLFVFNGEEVSDGATTSPSDAPVQPNPDAVATIASACNAPTPPSPIEGSTASVQEMTSAHDATVAFIANSDSYQRCLYSGLQVLQRVVSAGQNPRPIDPSIYAAITNLIDENQHLKEKVGREFNTAVSAYRAYHR